MKRIRTGVVGVGSLGKHHARIHFQLPSADLVGVADLDAVQGRKVAAECGCGYHSDFRELFGSVEAISLAVPTQDHSQIASQFLEKGIHVLVEKPIASSLEEADRMLEAQRRGGARLRVGHSERFNPAFRAVLPFVNQPGFFEGHRLGVFVPRSLDVDVVLDLMIHDIDLVLSLVDSPVVEIRAAGIPVLTPKVDIANARLQFENGCVANLTASRVSKDKVRKLRFFQPHDYVSVDFQAREVEMFSLSQGRIVPRALEIEDVEPLAAEIASFLAADADTCSGQDGRRALELGLEIKSSLEPCLPQ